MSSLESMIDESRFIQKMIDEREKNHKDAFIKERLKAIKKEKYSLLKDAGISQSEFNRKYSFISDRCFVDKTINYNTVIAFISNCKEKTLLLSIKKASKSRLDYLYSQEKLEVKNK